MRTEPRKPNTCIAYRDDGRICGRPASRVDHRRGGMVCAEHAERLDWNAMAREDDATVDAFLAEPHDDTELGGEA